MKVAFLIFLNNKRCPDKAGSFSLNTLKWLLLRRYFNSFFLRSSFGWVQRNANLNLEFLKLKISWFLLILFPPAYLSFVVFHAKIKQKYKRRKREKQEKQK